MLSTMFFWSFSSSKILIKYILITNNVQRFEYSVMHKTNPSESVTCKHRKNVLTTGQQKLGKESQCSTSDIDF